MSRAENVAEYQFRYDDNKILIGFIQNSNELGSGSEDIRKRFFIEAITIPLRYHKS